VLLLRPRHISATHPAAGRLQLPCRALTRTHRSPLSQSVYAYKCKFVQIVITGKGNSVTLGARLGRHARLSQRSRIP
jgi:hypothetical protein